MKNEKFWKGSLVSLFSGLKPPIPETINHPPQSKSNDPEGSAPFKTPSNSPLKRGRI